jgi:hypothetical protein
MKHIPYDLNPPLTLRSEIDPSPDCTGPETFAFRIHLFLENRTGIPAESPLILFPRLGLDIQPHPPMTIKPTMSGPRRLLACSAQNSLKLAPDDSLEACAIVFSYDRSSGAFSLSMNDSRQIGADMGDFRIFCATGAANFPLRRVELQVLAATLRAAIDTVFAPSDEAPQWQVEHCDSLPIPLSA